MRFLQGMTIAETALALGRSRRRGQAAPAARRTQPGQADARGDAGLMHVHPLAPPRNLRARPARSIVWRCADGRHRRTARDAGRTAMTAPVLGAATRRGVRRAASPEAPHPAHRARRRSASPTLLAVVADLRAGPRGRRPAPSSSPTLRERLMAEADTVLVPSRPAARAEQRLALPAPARAPRPPRRRPLLGGVALVGATASWPSPRRPPCPASRSTRVKRGDRGRRRSASPATTPPGPHAAGPGRRPASTSSRSSRAGDAGHARARRPTPSTPSPSRPRGVRSLLIGATTGTGDEATIAASCATSPPPAWSASPRSRRQLPDERPRRAASPPAGRWPTSTSRPAAPARPARGGITTTPPTSC